MTPIPNSKRQTEKKKPIRLTLSPSARTQIETQLVGDNSDLDVKSISELLEKIGQKEIALSKVDGDESISLLDVSIYKRLALLVAEPAAVFTSSLAFIERIMQKLGIESTEGVISTVMKRSICVLFDVGYTFPDNFINNPSAFLRWLSFCLVLDMTKQKGTEDFQKQSIKQEAINLKDFTKKINPSLKYMQVASRSHKMEAFKMKAIDGFTVSQILQLFKNQEKGFIEEKIHQRIKEGWSLFRGVWNSGSINESDVNHLPDLSTDFQSDLEKYVDLMNHEITDISIWSDKLEILLLKAAYNPFLDLMINEIDYYSSSKDEQLLKFKSICLGIEDSLHKMLSIQQDKLDEKMILVQDREALSKIVHDMIEADTHGCKIKIKPLLSWGHYPLMIIASELEKIGSLSQFNEIPRIQELIETCLISSDWNCDR
ncbi:MAG: hypothetical protein F6J87_15380 [Spirulina sp. SIO3F2]|nr:hypothetical protein [Spirulina sp. SIO3F2]